MLPPPRVEVVDGIQVVRDDLLPGGTKRRGLAGKLAVGHEYVYASPAFGYAQMALAHAAADQGASATIFVAQRRELHARTREAHRLGAKVVQVPTGYLSNVSAKARAYAYATGAVLLPFGLDCEWFVRALAIVAQGLPIDPPDEVWSVSGSGVLTRSLQMAWPKARAFVVRIGAESNIGGAVGSYIALEQFDRPAQRPPPFPSCPEYDAKAWWFVRRHASPGALFWNVGA